MRNLMSLTVMACSVAFGALVVSGCTASPSADDADVGRNAASLLGVEACFSNTLDERIDLVSTDDGSGVQWNGSVAPGQTVCTKSADGSIAMKGTMTIPNEPSAFTYRFANRSIGAPTAGIVLGVSDNPKASGRGVCGSYDELESGTYDTGTTRFTLTRLDDARGMKQFTVTIGASEGQVTPNRSCGYTNAN